MSDNWNDNIWNSGMPSSDNLKSGAPEKSPHEKRSDRPEVYKQEKVFGIMNHPEKVYDERQRLWHNTAERQSNGSYISYLLNFLFGSPTQEDKENIAKVVAEQEAAKAGLGTEHVRKKR